jgi:hypothetical protein
MDFEGVVDFSEPAPVISGTGEPTLVQKMQRLEQRKQYDPPRMPQKTQGGTGPGPGGPEPPGSELERPTNIKAAKRARGQVKKRKRSLPSKVIPITNVDKGWHESWSPGRDLLNIPHPFRAVIMGPPNSGKTTVVKNILMRADPPFVRMVVIYPDGGGFTDEYQDCGNDSVEMIDYIPPPSEWDGQKKTLCVVDDFELKGLSKEQRSNLDRLVGHVSTHRNVSVCVCNQDPYNAPPIVRRCANLYILWKQRDMVSLRTFARRLGLDLDRLFDEHCPGRFDSIWVDLTVDSPAPLRINGYDRLEWEEYSLNNRRGRRRQIKKLLPVEEEQLPDDDDDDDVDDGGEEEDEKVASENTFDQLFGSFLHKRIKN